MVIPSWSEGIMLMNVGSKYQLFIPSNMAYGEQGAGQIIPPYSTLIFTIELLDIVTEADDDEG
jgi:FKBP-type peptidyl-prolyl cis-trans isomerase